MEPQFPETPLNKEFGEPSLEVTRRHILVDVCRLLESMEDLDDPNLKEQRLYKDIRLKYEILKEHGQSTK